MNDVDLRERTRFLIVSGKVVLAEDLAEMLETELGASVDVFRFMDEGTWATDYAATFFLVPLQDMIQHERVRDLLKRGIPVVVVDGDIPPAYEEAGLLSLDPPFRRSDVMALLHKVGASGKV